MTSPIGTADRSDPGCIPDSQKLFQDIFNFFIYIPVIEFIIVIIVIIIIITVRKSIVIVLLFCHDCCSFIITILYFLGILAETELSFRLLRKMTTTTSIINKCGFIIRRGQCGLVMNY